MVKQKKFKYQWYNSNPVNDIDVKNNEYLRVYLDPTTTQTQVDHAYDLLKKAVEDAGMIMASEPMKVTEKFRQD